ncbi:MAG TPA: APC family permease [Gemmatimonadaceae bacterium]|nr:APC family permease [Gemmatimonadaceae bacterium]
MTSPGPAEPRSTERSAGAPTLDRALGLRDLVLFNLVAVLGLRWLATAAKAGPSAIALWLLAALFFFVPQGLVVIELSSRFPEEGGIYQWTKRALGETHGYVCGWCYWINNVLYYPNLLISAAVIATYAIGKGDSPLASDWTYVLPATLVCLWLAAGLNIVGVGTGKWLQNAGGIGTYVPGVIMVALAVAFIATGRPSANPLTPTNMVPNLGSLQGLNLWASIAFAFAGLELSSTMGGEVRDPRRTLPRSVLVSAPLIAAAYILGTAALLWIVPTGDVNIVSGLLQSITIGANAVSPALWWLAPLAAAAYTLGNIGGVGAWLTAPARVAFAIGLDRYFPPAFGRIHPTWKTPYVAILVQAALATAFLLVSVLGKGTTVEKAYLIILDTQLLIYFIPYVYLFICFLLHRRTDASADTVRVPGGALGARIVGISGLVVTVLAMVVATVPPDGETNPLLFEAKVVGGALGFVALGGVVYWRGRSGR